MLERKRTLTLGGVRHWELLALSAAAVLVRWEAAPSTLVAVLAVLAALAIPLRPAGRRAAPLLLAVLAAYGGVAAGVTAWRVRRIETAWGSDTTGVRGDLIERASRRLAADLSAAVASARDLADRAVRDEDEERLRLGAALAAATASRGFERGVVVFDGPEPLVWAGRHRVPADPDGPELSARITPFYVVLEARRQHGDRRAVAHVTLAADSAVPQRRAVFADRFQEATGVGLRFYPSSGGPREADVFDYCIPACSDATVRPDTLFGVRMDPPGQGAHKLRVEAGGRRGVAGAVMGLLIVLLVAGGSMIRLGAGAGLMGWLVLTPTTQRLWPDGPFSAATYFTGTLGPFTASAGALAVTAAAVVLICVVLLGRDRRGTPPRGAPVIAGLGLAGLLAVLPELASGITPPAAGPSAPLWILWQVGLTLAIAAPLSAIAVLLAWNASRSPGWMTAGAVGWAALAAAVRVMSWSPAGWPSGFLVLWLPAFMLAVQPAGRARLTLGIGLTAGACAAVLTWGAVADGRLLMAARDVATLRRGGDPIAIGLLERLGARLRDGRPPTTVAGLYAQWTRSPLAVDGYPAVLGLWSPTQPDPTAELGLADLPVPRDSSRAAVARAREAGEPMLHTIPGVPSVRYVLAVPWPDGTVATVVLGPRSRVVAPARIARFLRGDPARAAPYSVALTDPVPSGGPVTELAWRREGTVVRGEELLRFADGTRHVHVIVPLGTTPGLPVRGALLLLVDLTVVGLLVLTGRVLGGAPAVPAGVRRFVGTGSFRARLALALVLFFVVPTVAFAAWTARRLDAEAERSRDLIIRQTLQDASGTAREFVPQLAARTIPMSLARELLRDLGDRLGADLMLYHDGQLLQTTPGILAEMGVVDPYLPLPVLARMVGGDVPEVEVDEQIAGRATRVGYRALGTPAGLSAVLGAPRLAEDPELVRSEQDLAFGLVLITLLGIAAALAFATVASRALARPVRELRDAALQVGRGNLPAPLDDMPYELQPVAEGFARMARDVERGRVALEAQRARTAAVLRSVATGILALDDTLRIIAANQRAEELLGHGVEVGTTLAEVGGADWRPVWRWLAEQAAAHAAPDPAEFSVGEREIRVQFAPLSGAATGWVVAFDDTTERTRAVRVLAWGELARQIAHEIKNPLTPIRLGVQHLERSWQASRGDFGETLGRTSRQILAEIERLDAVARAFSRFGAPLEATGALERVDVVQAAREVAGLYALGEVLRVGVEPETPVPALARRDELKEVLVNLVDNARNAGARTVAIEARPENGRVLLTVRDDGRGIAAADLPHIFEPRFSTTTSGAGLGLAISRRLVESWGGAVTAESRPGDATTLTLELLS